MRYRDELSTRVRRNKEHINKKHLIANRCLSNNFPYGWIWVVKGDKWTDLYGTCRWHSKYMSGRRSPSEPIERKCSCATPIFLWASCR